MKVMKAREERQIYCRQFLQLQELYCTSISSLQLKNDPKIYAFCEVTPCRLVKEVTHVTFQDSLIPHSQREKNMILRNVGSDLSVQTAK